MLNDVITIGNVEPSALFDSSFNECRPIHVLESKVRDFPSFYRIEDSVFGVTLVVSRDTSEGITIEMMIRDGQTEALFEFISTLVLRHAPTYELLMHIKHMLLTERNAGKLDARREIRTVLGL